MIKRKITLKMRFGVVFFMIMTSVLYIVDGCLYEPKTTTTRVDFQKGFLVGGPFLDNLRALGIKAGQWTTAAQDKGEWRRTVEQGAQHFMGKRIAAEKANAGLRHAVVCPNVTGNT